MANSSKPFNNPSTPSYNILQNLPKNRHVRVGRLQVADPDTNGRPSGPLLAYPATHPPQSSSTSNFYGHFEYCGDSHPPLEPSISSPIDSLELDMDSLFHNDLLHHDLWLFNAHPHITNYTAHISPQQSNDYTYSIPQWTTPSNNIPVYQGVAIGLDDLYPSLEGGNLLGYSNVHFESGSTAASVSQITLSPRKSSPPITLNSYQENLHLLDFAKTLFCRIDAIVVPQPIYRPPGQSYMVEKAFMEPIIFRLNELSCGTSITQFLAKEGVPLMRGDQKVFEGAGQCISIRINWPGYNSWTRQMATQDYRKPRSLITLEHAAFLVARMVKYFYDDVIRGKAGSFNPKSGLEWRIGKEGIQLGDIVLVSLHNVSRGSWQPQVRVRTSRHAY